MIKFNNSLISFKGVPFKFKDFDWYGIERNINEPNSSLIRIGNPDLHRSLPIHNKMRRCLLLDNGEVNYYLHSDNSLLKEDGTSSVLDGSDGQVMVEIPDFYIKFETDGDIQRVKISEIPLDGFTFVNKRYYGAYKATVDRINLKMSSVVNITPQYRGGNNNSDWDLDSRSLLGKAASVISLNNFRTYARNRNTLLNYNGWSAGSYETYKYIFWLRNIEYANLNAQLGFNENLTSSGYKQGGLGSGVTNLNGTLWNNFNSYYPFIPCGYTNSLGNNTGVIDFIMPSEYGILTTSVNSYRGIENYFGEIFEWLDGILIQMYADDDLGISQLYTNSNPEEFNSSILNYNYIGLIGRTEGYTKHILFGNSGEIVNTEISSSLGSTTYFCDYWYVGTLANSLRGVYVGGNGYYGGAAGPGYLRSGNTPSSASTNLGSRIYYTPQKL